MLAQLLSTSMTPIGLDVGVHGVRAVQLRRRARAYAVEAATRVERPDVLSESKPEEGSVSGFIRSCLQQASFHGNDVRAGLSMPDIDFHALELPETIANAKDEEVENIVQWEIQRLTTRQSEKLVTGHWLLPDSRPATTNAIGVASSEERVMQMVSVCRNADLVCTQVDAVAAALARFGYLAAEWSDDLVWGLLDFGFRQTRLILCVDDLPVLVRHAGTGGQAWTKRIAEELRVSQKTAEFHKREAGIELVGRGVRGDAAAAPRSELGAILTGILRSDLNTIAAEVKRSYEYVLSCYPSRRAGGLLMVGGGAALRNLPEFLSSVLGIPVHRASHHAKSEESRLDVAKCCEEDIDELAVSIALAIDA